MINIKNNILYLNTIKDFIIWTLNKFNTSNLYYGHGTSNSLDESFNLILNTLFISINSKKEIYKYNLTFQERTLIIKRVMKRIYERIPVPYLINKSYFCGLEFYIDNRVFIPRSPMSEIIINKFNKIKNYNPKNILDMCTGSGCIAISCAYIYPEAKIDATDISLNALLVAKKNIKKHKMKKRINIIYSDLFNNINKNKIYDLIITNPPYVNKKDIINSPLEFHHEPLISLYADIDGLKFIKRILSSSFKFLSKNGILVCEVGNNIVNIINLYPNLPFRWLKFYKGGYGVFILNKKNLNLIN
ncbi:MAG: 50S ribosomal protein L3 N(5)-glutamine methyltransferase [Candidatus Makana argininalis]